MDSKRRARAQESALQLKRAVAEIETRTCADIVVVLRTASSRYEDLSLWFAAGCSFVLLTYLVFSPKVFEEIWWPLDVAAVFIIAWRVAQNSTWRGRLPLQRRFRKQVDKASRLTFYNLGMDRTQRRLATLVYVSALEKQARILPDIGAMAGLSSTKLLDFEERLANAWHPAAGEAQAVIPVLNELGHYLAEVFPRGDETMELPDDIHDDGGDVE